MKLPSVNIPVTSGGDLCGNCWKLIKKITTPNV